MDIVDQVSNVAQRPLVLLWFIQDDINFVQGIFFPEIFILLVLVFSKDTMLNSIVILYKSDIVLNYHKSL